MDIKALKYFTAVVEAGSISRAAEVLNMSQPPLSLQIKSLEQELGVSLLVRKSQGVTATDEGIMLYRRAQKILEMVDNTKHDIMLMNKSEIGCLRIGCVDSMENYIMTNYISCYRDLYKNVIFQFLTGDSDEIFDFLDKREIDIGIIRYPLDEKKYDFLPLANEELIAVVPDEFSQSDESVDFEELNLYPILIHKRYQYVINDYYKKNGCDFTPYCISNDTHNIIRWAEGGFGIAIVPAYAISNIENNNLHFRSIGDAQISTKTALVWDKNVYISNTARSFIDLFQKRVSE